jgi:formylglycine-generating enzyme required for sulfatase activity
MMREGLSLEWIMELGNSFLLSEYALPIGEEMIHNTLHPRLVVTIFIPMCGAVLYSGQPIVIPTMLQPGQTWVDPMLNVEFQYCPPGLFKMGTKSDYIYHVDDQAPQHNVKIGHGFLLGKNAVTQATWNTIMGDNPSTVVGDGYPVVMVSWHDCQLFVEKLNTKIGFAAYRLPTEAEWEYACLAGSSEPVNEDKAIPDEHRKTDGLRELYSSSLVREGGRGTFARVPG